MTTYLPQYDDLPPSRLDDLRQPDGTLLHRTVSTGDSDNDTKDDCDTKDPDDEYDDDDDNDNDNDDRTKDDKNTKDSGDDDDEDNNNFADDNDNNTTDDKDVPKTLIMRWIYLGAGALGHGRLLLPLRAHDWQAQRQVCYLQCAVQ